MESIIGFLIIYYLERKEPIPIGSTEIILIAVASVAETFLIAFGIAYAGITIGNLFYVVGFVSFTIVPYFLFTRWLAKEPKVAMNYTGILLAVITIGFLRSRLLP